MSSHINQYRPWMPWRQIVGENHGLIKVTPGFAMAATLRGNLSNETLDIMTVTVITTRAIFKMMGKPEDYEV